MSPFQDKLLFSNRNIIICCANQPQDYPLSPFKMKFDPPLLHPNSTPDFIFDFILQSYSRGATVYPDGTVCISILHTPGDDPTMYEQASERWSPVQSVEKVILSVISMLAGTPNLKCERSFDIHVLLQNQT